MTILIDFEPRDSAARWIAAPGDDGKTRVHEAVRAVTLLLRRHFPGTAVYPIGTFFFSRDSYSFFNKVVASVNIKKLLQNLMRFKRLLHLTLCKSSFITKGFIY